MVVNVFVLTENCDKALTEFHTDPNAAVFLLSLRSGGAGLTLVAANHVVLCEPCIDSQVEAQARPPMNM